MPDLVRIIGDDCTKAIVNAAGAVKVFGDLVISDTSGSTYTVDFAKDIAAAEVYLLLVDLDGANYPHVAGAGCKLHWLGGHLTKAETLAHWTVELLVVLAINGADSTLAALSFGTMHLEDSVRFENEVVKDLSSHAIDLTVSGGVLTKTLARDVRTNVTAINTAVTIEDASGVAVAPAVGDILVHAVRGVSPGSANLHYTAIYEVS